MPIEIRELIIKATVVTVSDACARGERKDTSGETLVELLRELDVEIFARLVLSDDIEPLRETLQKFAAHPDVNLIITTGGTGFSPRDNTPEATRSIIEREAPGLAEAMRIQNLENTRMAMLSRGVCGITNGTLIINLPGSPKGVRESFAVIAKVLKHAIALLAGIPGGDLH